MRKNHRYTQEETEFLTLAVAAGLSQKETATQFNERFGCNLAVNVLAMKCYNLGLGMGKRGKRREQRKIGDEYVIKSRNEIYIKVAEPRVLRPKSHIVWERSYGVPVPTGHIIIFLDGDSMNCEIGNLAVISRSVNARINQLGLRTPDPALTEVGINIGTVLAEVGKAQRRRRADA